MKKIAIPVTRGLLDAHFGHCRQFALVDIEENQRKDTQLVDAPPHQPGMLPPWLAERGVTDIIAGGMGQRAIQLFNDMHINVFVGAPQRPVEELIDGFLQGTISFAANYCDH